MSFYVVMLKFSSKYSSKKEMDVNAILPVEPCQKIHLTCFSSITPAFFIRIATLVAIFRVVCTFAW